jgi:type II restriction enzyme
MPIIAESSIASRRNWIEEIQRLSGDFGADTTRLSSMLTEDISCNGNACLRDHLRLCGAIPEKYPHDSSEEKLYSKYTDHLLSLAFGAIGIRSLVLAERADAADVECWADDYEFVADAKAFRLSRTAKNQKDFKVQAMHGWKRHRLHAMVVCPLYQLPARSSQIYYQAINSEVCIFSFSHLSLLISFAETNSKEAAKALLRSIFNVTSTLQPSKDANSYWGAINRTILGADSSMGDLWRIEKAAAAESLLDAKEEGLLYLDLERSRIMRMNHDEALRELIKLQNLDARARVISAVRDNGLMGVT